ncbi:MAG TPA: hypothetical protein VN365_03065 [Candidatus Thermoplasmatota archaeon]|nr:hypothetical protein [Candidatus Thermoplasmatota archaeon]
METTTSIVEVRLSSPTLLGGNKVSVRQIRETIILSSGAWVGIESKGLIRVNSTLYNLKYYDLIGSDSTQKATIQKALKQLTPHTSKTITSKHKSTINTVDDELKQLESLTILCKKLNTYHDRDDKLRNETDENKTELLRRKQQKEKALIQKHLQTLKSDPSFSIDGIKALYKGHYVQASKVINLGGF